MLDLSKLPPPKAKKRKALIQEATSPLQSELGWNAELEQDAYMPPVRQVKAMPAFRFEEAISIEMVFIGRHRMATLATILRIVVQR